MAMKMLYLKPKPGLIVRNPRNEKPLPEYGAAVPASSYWTRRLRDGDVEKTSANAVKKAEAAQAEADKAAAAKEE